MQRQRPHDHQKQFAPAIVGGVKGGHAPTCQAHPHTSLQRPLVHKQQMECWPKGLANVGNSCYANAALQCLLSTALTNALLDPMTVPLFRKYSSNANLLALGSGSVDSEDDITVNTKTDGKEASERQKLRRQNKEREKRRMHDNCEWLTKELTAIAEEYTLQQAGSSASSSVIGWITSQQATTSLVVDPGSITKYPDRLSKCLRPYQQEDAHEFMRALLSTLVMNGHNKQLSSLFDGLLESAVTCSMCGRTSLTRDRYMDLSLDINHPHICNLDDALRDFSKSEVLDQENSVFCQKCDKKQSVTKGLRLATAPSILVCHLKRFAFDHYGRLIRLHKKIECPLRLEIGDYMSHLNKARPPPYDLVGVLVHQGQTCLSGHYLAFVKKNNEWFRCNDSVVTKVDLETVLDQQAYILMYEVAEMRAKTCYSKDFRKQKSMNDVELKDSFSRDQFSARSSSHCGPRSSRPRSEYHDTQAKIIDFFTAAEGGLNNFLADLCCDNCNTGINEPKSKMVKQRLRRKAKQVQEDSASTSHNCDTSIATTDSFLLMQRSFSGEDFQNEFDRCSSNRSHTAPRQRTLRTHSFANSDPGGDAMDSPDNGHSTRSENARRKPQNSSKSRHHHNHKQRRERGRSVHAVGDMGPRDLPPLPTTPGHRRAKSSTAPRKKHCIV